MALKDIQIPKVDVQVGSDSFAVRALNLTDIEHLVRQHGEDLRGLFKEFITDAKKGSTELTDLMPVFKQIAGRCPELVVAVIGLASDADAEDLAVLRKLGLSVHIDALIKIATLTLSTEGDMGKALETVIKALGNVNGGLAEVLAARAGL